jgi:hypothetical protein
MLTTERRAFSLKTGTWNAELPALDGPRTLVLAFGASSLLEAPDTWRRLHLTYPHSHVVGCSTAGEINGTDVQDDSIAVAVTRFERTDLQIESVRVESGAESFAAGLKLGAALAKRPGLRAVFLLSEGLKVNGSELVRGCNDAVGKGVIVTGGLSGDGSRFQRTWVGVGDAIASGLVAAVGFYGDHIVVTHGSRGGWDQFGPERVITKSVGNIIHEIDGQPALLLYKKYLGDKAKDLPGSGLLFPLEMRRDEKDDRPLVRTLLAVDETKQSLTFAGDTPQGHRVRLMKANFDRLVDGAAGAGQLAHEGLKDVDGGCLAVAVSCVGRRLVLGQRTEEEVEATLAALPRGTEVVGFYSYGELSPFLAGAACELHNQTMTVTTFSESRGASTRDPVPTAAASSAMPAQPAAAAAAVPPAAAGASSPSDEHAMVTMRRGLSLKTGAWDAALPPLDSERTLVLAFGASSLLDAPDTWRQLKARYPRSAVVGCSTAGEINGTLVADDTLAVSVTRFGRTDVRVESVSVGEASESFSAGLKLGAALARRPGLRAVFILSEGLKVNGSELVRGCNDAVGKSVVVTGGLSGDGSRFQRTWVGVGDTIASGLVAAVGLYGDHIVVTHGSRGGWDQFGPERVITKSVGNVIHEIDGEPALALYKKYLGEKAKDLPGSGLLFPLEMRRDEKDEKPLVRTLLAVDEAKQSLTFAGDTPQGHRVRLMKANFDRLVEGAQIAGKTAADARTNVNGACLAVAVSCVGRRLVLGQRTEEEVEATLAALPKGSEIVGFYSYGELSPFVAGAVCELHNQTMTVTTFSEADTPLHQSEDAEELRLMTTVGGGLSSAPTVKRHEYSLKTRSWGADKFEPLDSPRTLVVAFGSTRVLDEPDAIRQLRRQYPTSHVVGCSTAGEINGAVVKDDSVAVAVMRFERTELQTEVARVKEAGESLAAGRSIGERLAKKDGLRAVFVLSEGLKVNGSELVRGINDAVGSDVIVTGGLSGDGSRFQRTWVTANGDVESGLIAAVGFYGDHIHVAHGSRGGWDQFGPERVITKSTGNVIHEIDGQPALLLYKKYLGEKAKDLPGSGLLFPLQIRRDETDERPLVRTLLAVDEAAQSLTFAGDVPQGFRVRLMKANFDRLVKGAGDAADAVQMTWTEDGLKTPVHLALAISCVGRRLVLGTRTDEEVEATLKALPRGTELVGFYSYGELSPYTKGVACELHNQTMTLTMFSESPRPIERVPSPPPAPAATAVMPFPSAVSASTTELPAARPPSPSPAPSPSSSPPPPPVASPPPPPVASSPPPPVASPPPPPVASPPPPPVASPPPASPPPPTPTALPSAGALRGRTAAGVGETPRTSPTMPAVAPGAFAQQTPPSTSTRPTTRTDLPVRAPRPVAFLPPRSSTANARVVSRRVGNVTVVGITGKLAEGFKGRDTARELSGLVVLDLIGVERVTSYGVREWLAFLEELAPRVQQLFLVRCSEAIVAQLGMIRGFAGKGTILSCMAPFTCSCGAQCNGLMDMRLHGRDIARGEVPSPKCPVCGNENTQFDDDPRAYFVFQSDRVPPVPPEVDDAIAQLETRAVEAVEKVVDANGTRITVNSELDAAIRWQRILDGVEGQIVIDLQRSPRSTADGTVALANAIRSQLGPQDRIEIVAAPQEILQYVETWPSSAATIVLQSAWVEGFCADCNAGRRVLVNVADHVDVLKSGGAPTLLCPRHSKPLDFSRARSVLALLVPPPPKVEAPPPPVVVPPPAPVAAPAPVATFAPVTAPTATPAIASSPVAAVAPAPSRSSPVLWALVGALGVALVGALALRPDDPPPTPTPTPPPPTATMATAATAATATTATTANDLPPDWVARPVTVDAGAQAVWVVGKAGPSRTREQLLEAATDDAVLKLVAYVERTARPGVSQQGDFNDDVFRQRVRKQFDETWGIHASPVRSEMFITERAEGFQGAFRFKVASSAVDKLVAELAETVSPLGMTVGRIRVTEAVALQSKESLVVTAVKGGAAALGVRVGDTVVSVGGEPVRTLQDFDERLRSGYTRGTVVVVNREGVLTSITWRKPTPP